VSAVTSLEGPLLQVEGLSDLRLELHSKKMNMHLVLIDELHRHLYIKSTSKVGQRNKEKGRVSSHVKEASALPLLDVTNLSTPRKFDSAQFSSGELLLELLELLFDKFNAVAAAHAIVLGHLQQTVTPPVSQYDGDIKLYDMADVWVKIQDVLQMLLTEYLDMKNTRASSEPSAQLSYASSGREFGAFFAKKKPQRPKTSLF
ncbi:exocyst complex component 4-like, partial [Protobothrops mucrosquamatus]|uniref:exocyst complex component 4-like n=1 Tax=Protobothrops mucrosquamatus TaxID=103944 RepID=UPI000775DCDB